MHRLILLRHGKAEHESAGGGDFDRRLTSRGVRESAGTGEALADVGLAPDVALVSTSARTRETWDAVRPSFAKAEASFDADLYHAHPETIWRCVEEAGAGAGTVMVVGHNPGLQELAIMLLVKGAADAHLVAQAQRNFPTAAAATFIFDGEGGPHFDGFFLPKHR